MNLEEKTTKNILLVKVSLLIFLIVISFFVASAKATDLPVFQHSVSTLDDSKEMVMNVTKATLGMSLVITFLPDDWGTPLADELADMNKYLVFMLGMIFVESLLITKGVPLVFKLIIPIALVLLLINLFTKKRILKVIATKLLALSLVVLLVVPCGTAISNWLCADGMSYVNETVTMVEEDTEQVEGITEGAQDKSFYEKISGVFNTAIEGAKDLFDYYKGVVGKFLNAIAIMVVAYCVIPVATFLLLFWILNQLFQFESFRIEGKNE